MYFIDMLTLSVSSPYFKFSKYGSGPEDRNRPLLPHHLHPHHPTILLHISLTFSASISMIVHPPPVLHLHINCPSEQLLPYFVHTFKNLAKIDMEKEMEITPTNPTTPALITPQPYYLSVQPLQLQFQAQYAHQQYFIYMLTVLQIRCHFSLSMLLKMLQIWRWS